MMTNQKNSTNCCEKVIKPLGSAKAWDSEEHLTKINLVTQWTEKKLFQKLSSAQS